MSRTRDLKTNPDNNLNLFEMLSLFSPERKTKYTEMFLRILKSTPDLPKHSSNVRKQLSDGYGISKTDLNEFSDLQVVLFYVFLDNLFDKEDISSFQKFCEYNEKGLIKQNDLSKYRDFTELVSEVEHAETIIINKELQKQVKIVFEDSEWLLIRPLTYNSSKKYGSNTKWCTTSESSPDYFMKYSTKGVLIYCINKKTDYKVASFCSLDVNEREFSFWNQADERVDSLDTELTNELREIIRLESKINNPKPNRSLLSDVEFEKEKALISKLGHSYNSYVPPVELSQDRVDYISRNLNREEEIDSDDGVAIPTNTDEIIRQTLNNLDIRSYVDMSDIDVNSISHYFNGLGGTGRNS
jgi:hypothetical protein